MRYILGEGSSTTLPVDTRLVPDKLPRHIGKDGTWWKE